MTMMRTRTPMAIAAAGLLLLSACGGGDEEAARAPRKKATSPEPKATPTGGDRVEVEVEAEDFAFERSTYTVPAGAAIELKFQNRDDEVPHTFTVYEDDTAEQEIFDTGNLIGDREKTYEFDAPSEAGTYYFQCDVHPDMNGDFVVK